MSTPLPTFSGAASSAATAARPVDAPPSRVAWVDSLRIALTILVVAHHAAITYSSIPLWYWSQPGSDPTAGLLTAFVITNQLWFMGAFFLLSGLFVPGSYDRKGGRGFVTDRLLRLGVPLVIFVALLRPIVMAPTWFVQHAADPDSVPSLPRFLLTAGDPGPTWFLEVLLVLSLGYAAVRALTRRDPAPVSPRRLPGWGPAAMITTLALATVGWRLAVPDGTYWPIVGLPTPAFLPQYVIMFVAGLLAARHGWLSRLRPAQLWPALVSVVLGAAAVVAGLLGAGPAPAALSGIGQAMFAIGLVVAVSLLFRSRFDAAPGRWRTFLSQQAFTVYLIHPVILVAWSVVTAGLPLPAVAHAALLLVLSLPTCWLAAAGVRRIPGLRRVL